MKQITEDRYDELLGAVPPIYIKKINGLAVSGGFVLTEPYSTNSKGFIFTLCWRDGENYYEALANVKIDGEYLRQGYDRAYETGEAMTVTTLHRACKKAVAHSVLANLSIWICPVCGPVKYGFDVIHVPKEIS